MTTLPSLRTSPSVPGHRAGGGTAGLHLPVQPKLRFLAPFVATDKLGKQTGAGGGVSGHGARHVCPAACPGGRGGKGRGRGLPDKRCSRYPARGMRWESSETFCHQAKFSCGWDGHGSGGAAGSVGTGRLSLRPSVRPHGAAGRCGAADPGPVRRGRGF